MSLNKQPVHLNLTGGLQNKTDPRLTIPSKLSVADNVEFDDLNTVKRRGGVVGLSSVAINGASMDTAKRLWTHQGRVGIEANDADYIMSSAGMRRILGTRKGTYSGGSSDTDRAARAMLQTTPIGRANRRYATNTTLVKVNYDSCVSGDGLLVLTAWEQQSGDGSHTVEWRLETVAGEEISRGSLTGPDPTYVNVALSPRVVPTATGFYLCYATYNYFAGPNYTYGVNAAAINNVGTITASTPIYTSTSVAGRPESSDILTCLFDVASYPDGTGNFTYGCVFRDINAAGTLTLNRRDSSMNSVWIQTAAPIAAPTGLTAFMTNVGATFRVHAFYTVTAVGNVLSRFATNAAISAEIIVGTAPTGTPFRIAVGFGQNSNTGTTGSDIVIAFDYLRPTGAVDLRFSKFTATHTGIASADSNVPGWCLAGHIVNNTNRDYLLLQAVPSVSVLENPTTTFVIDLSYLLDAWNSAAYAPVVMARIAIGESLTPGINTRPGRRLPRGLYTTPGTGAAYDIAWPLIQAERDLVLVNNANETGLNIALAKLGLKQEEQLGFVEINELTYLAGGCPQIFDGTQVVEENFHHAPLIRAAALHATLGYGPFAAGTASFVWTEAWTDAQGNFHESAPSPQFTVTFTAPLPYLNPVIQRPTTRKPGSQLRVYRTKITSTDTSLYLTVTENGTVVTSDTILGGGEQLYTAGNVLPNTPMPACRHISVFQKRLVASGCEDPQRVYWSKQSELGYGVEFTVDDPTHQTRVNDSKGRVVATEELSDRLVMFCENVVGTIYGQGPAATGTQGSYSDFTSLVFETGALWTSPRAVIRTPEGLWFHSPFGIRLLTTSGSLATVDGRQVGSEVDSYVGNAIIAVGGGSTYTLSTFTNGQVPFSRQQTRFFVQNGGYCLVWDYQWQQWSKFNNHYANDAVFGNKRTTFIGGTNTLFYTDDTGKTQSDENSTTGSGGVVYKGRIETPWLSMAGVQMFQRLYMFKCLAAFVRPKNASPSASAKSNFTLRVAYNYDDSNLSSADLTNVVLSAIAVDSPIQFEHHFAQQKCEAVKLILEFWPEEPFDFVGIRVSDLTLQVGVKYGSFKLPSSQRF